VIHRTPYGVSLASSRNLPSLDIEVSSPTPGVAVVALKGDHDLSTSPELRALLQTLVAENPKVLVDVTEAEFIDSTVLHTLMLTDGLAREVDHRFILVAGTKPIVSTALRVSGLIDCLQCANSVEEALSMS
jgi:anti-sigma B factor antagonist